MCPIPDKFLSIGEGDKDFTRLSVTLLFHGTGKREESPCDTGRHGRATPSWREGLVKTAIAGAPTGNPWPAAILVPATAIHILQCRQPFKASQLLVEEMNILLCFLIA